MTRITETIFVIALQTVQFVASDNTMANLMLECANLEVQRNKYSSKSINQITGEIREFEEATNQLINKMEAN